MRFVLYTRPSAAECKVDWDAAVDVTEDVRRALRPQEPEALRAGRLRRPFLCKPPTLGRRSARVRRSTPPVRHPAGARVFSTLDELCVWVEVDDDDDPPHSASGDGG